MSTPNLNNSILVADDSLTIRKLVETVLREDGYKVIAVENGADCIAQAAAQKPSLILLDYILPDMQGTEVCRNLINSPETWEIPILMMSSNGNAIRQLYQDLNNVADYLTKPFAPNVLKAVVGHLLQKEKPAASAEPVSAPSGVEAALVSAAVSPNEFMEKMTRLLALMEKPAAAEATQKNEAAAAAPAEPAKAAAPNRPKTRRVRKTVAAPTSTAVLRKFRLALQKHLRMPLKQIPAWEAVRGIEEPEEFFLSRILAKEVLKDLSVDLMTATGTPSGAEGALRCPSELAPLDVVVRHLNTSQATGELRIELEEETVLACFEHGQIVMLTSNHPRNYCAGAACDFQAVPHAAIGEAVRAQQEQSLPFFISLKQEGALPAGVEFEKVLLTQGESCLRRAFQTGQYVTMFSPLARLSATARTCKTPFCMNQLLLVCFRTVDDWFTLEKVISDMDATFVLKPGTESQLAELVLNEEETKLMQAVRLGKTIPALSEITGLKPFETCRLLFRFIKLGLVQQGGLIPASTPVEEPATILPKPVVVVEAVLPASAKVDLEAAPAAPSEVAAVEPATAPALVVPTVEAPVQQPVASPSPALPVEPVVQQNTAEPGMNSHFVATSATPQEVVAAVEPASATVSVTHTTDGLAQPPVLPTASVLPSEPAIPFMEPTPACSQESTATVPPSFSEPAIQTVETNNQNLTVTN